MGALVNGDDGQPAERVGPWAREKHALLCDYVQISAATRKKYLPPTGTGGAALIDLFCGPGRVQFEDNDEFGDGGCVAAWRKSVAAGSPFSRVIIGDVDPVKLEASRSRLEREGAADIQCLLGPASETCFKAIQKAGGLGLHFAFLDPYSLGVLDFHILKTLSRLQRIDVLVHVSQMDLQRNFDLNSARDTSALDVFAPGWREGADTNRGKKAARQAYFDYWKSLVAGTGIAPSPEIRLVTSSGNLPLYLLMLATRHDLARRFWSVVSKKDDPQGVLL